MTEQKQYKTDITFKILASKREEFLKQAEKLFDSLLYQTAQDEKTSKLDKTGNFFVPYQFELNVSCKFISGEVLLGGFVRNPFEEQNLIARKEYSFEESKLYSD